MSQCKKGKEAYAALVEFADGTLMPVYIREAESCFVDAYGTRFRKDNGILTSNRLAHPRLLLDSIKLPPELPFQVTKRKMTHEIEVIRSSRVARGGFVRCCMYLGTILTIEGDRFHPSSGIALKGPHRARVASLRPIYAYQGVQLPYSIALKLNLVPSEKDKA